MSPCSVPTAGVRGAVMGTNNGPKTSASPERRYCLRGRLWLPTAARPGEVPCPCLGTACLGQVLSASLAQEPGRASWLPALFADPILFPCSGSRLGRRRAGGRRAGSLLSAGARVASPCSRLL